MKPSKKRPNSSKAARRIWRAAFGEVPRDERGVSFDVHHRDGNPANNSLDNLEALSVRDHYQRHLGQKDWLAAFCIAQRLDISVEEQKEISARISFALKGRKISPEWKEKISRSLTGRKWTKEQRDKIPKSLKGRKFPKEFGLAISKRMTGRVVSDETRKKLSLSHLGKKHSEETRKKMSISRSGKTRSRDAVEKTIATRRKNGSYAVAATTRKKISETQKGRKKWPHGRSIETIRKIKETLQRKRLIRGEP